MGPLVLRMLRESRSMSEYRDLANRLPFVRNFGKHTPDLFVSDGQGNEQDLIQVIH